MSHQKLDAGRLRHPWERRLLGVCIAGSLALFAGLLLLATAREPLLAAYKSESIASWRATHPEAESLPDEEILPLLSAEDISVISFLESLDLTQFLLLPLGVVLLTVWGMGRNYGKLRANAVRISARQFPEVYSMWAGIARDLGLKKVPDLYTINGNGQLNAYASCVPGFRRFSAVYSDILETCVRNEDWDSLRFILAHEAGHIRLRHVEWWYILFTYVFSAIPLLNYLIGLPLGRAKEYSCDKVGHAFAQDHDCKGLLMLTAGKHLYHQLDIDAHIEETVEQGGKWQTLWNLTSSHPILAWRVNAVRKGHNGGIFLRRK